ncbi:related to CCC2 - P-type ATPase involved in export of Cu++ from the cytosol into intracellular, s [Cephalotrichum gorgonifer]|uniref:Related to CCC2 - P-type ATPase involved in export of Cu++ from the cytosol into intracellular, s n=1 Tax=Cephalotrichum gorgonifer TaxID=2041049 RepID=A0AAE8SXK5_9PEZI|nr:related to CCC2 - P-type ATPase involved in export of Cu++ from the cytosol into intracellular, s [Cephalotrichum gorgonifer]
MAPKRTNGDVGVPPEDHTHVTTSYLLGNLHCPSCVSSIKHVLRETCDPDVLWVSPNIVTSVVTVEHRPTERASVLNMKKALEDAGFEVEAVASTTTDDTQRQALSQLSQPNAGDSSRDAEEGMGIMGGWLWNRMGRRGSRHAGAANSAHIKNCEQCKERLSGEGEGHCADPDSTELEKTMDGSATTTPASARPSVAELESVAVAGEGPAWRATYAVGGMTCAVCVNTITDELIKIPWTYKVAVNLVSNSATVDFIEEGRENDIAEAIEDLGYEATLDKVVSLEKRSQGPKDERTVEIRVDGLFCKHCPGRLTRTLDGFQKSVKVISPATLESPIIKISYVPDAPTFTIRHILRAIEATDPSFSASIFHPPTLEERSRVIRRRHQLGIIRRLIITGIVTIPTFVLGIVYMSLLPHTNPGAMYLMEPWTSGLSRLQVSLCILSTIVYFFGADEFHVRSYKEVRTMWKRGSRTPIIKRFTTFGSMNMLISLGTTVAYFSSVIQMIYAAAANQHHFRDKDVYFDTVVFLTLFILAGRLIESYSKSKTGDAVDLLRNLKPNTAILVEGDKELEHDTVVDVDKLEIGDFVRIPSGASPPGDGTVVKGETEFDESSLTGEARLVSKSVGDEVFAGTVNKTSPIVVKVTGVGGTSMLDQIVNVVQEGQTKRAPMEQIADTMTSYFVPVITLFAIITWVVWIAVGYAGAVPDDIENDGSWVAYALQFSIAVFVVACPCGLALAAPTAIFVGGGIAAKHGILVKGGGEAFEKASKIGCVVFDKTGTLTTGGDPKVTDAEIYPDAETTSDDEALQLLAAIKAVEDNSSHPVARAISAYCASRTTSSVTVGDLQEIAGKGMKATYHTGDAEKSWELLVGNEGLLRDFGVPISEKVAELIKKWGNEAKSIAMVVTKAPGADAAWTLGAALSISDDIRPEAIPIIKMLKESGRQVWMISGDNAFTAGAVARLVGIDPSNVIAGVLPSEKSDKISYLQKTLKEGRSTTRRALVAMVGDGINDSPALTVADVGIAIGSGSDIAISSADFVLVKSDLGSVLTLLDLSRAVFRRIMVNFGWAVVFNLCAVPIAAGVLFPIRTSGGGRVKLDPAWAALAMALSSISVVLSSLALRWGIPGVGFRARKL